jgi:opacity protein-like surface antigen
MKAFLMSRLVSRVSLVAICSLSSSVYALEEGQTYIAVQGGLVQPESHDFNNSSAARVSTKLEEGYVVVGAIGRSFRNNLRTEVEGAYRQNDVDNHSTTGPALAGSEGQAKVASAMVNGYYDVPTSVNIKPYIGGGVGVARVSYDNYATVDDGVILDDANTVAAFQGMVGLSAPVHARLSLNAEYRYFTTLNAKVAAGSQESDTSYNTHNFIVGARYAF